MKAKDVVKVEYETKGAKFEILVNQEEADKYRRNRAYDFLKVLFVHEIFKDTRTGERASLKDIKNSFGTTDVIEVAKRIFDNGKIQLTTEQVRKMKEAKWKEIVNIITKLSKDPRINAPHTHQRIEMAMKEAKVNIDPMKSADEQYLKVIEKIREIIPISLEAKELVLKIPLAFTGRIYGVLREMCKIRKEEWTSDFLYLQVEIPAGMEADLLEKLNRICPGEFEVREIKK